jgi:PAS domain S-box-containing protein
LAQTEATLGTVAKQTVVLARHPSVAGVISTVGVAVAYFFAARLSLALLGPVDGVAVFWPAAGVASGILIALGPAARWNVVVGVMAATIVANLLGDRNIWSSVFFAFANAGDTVIIAGLLHRICGSPFKLNELRRVLALFAATVAGASLSGIAGTVGFVMFHGSTASPPVVWLHWFSSDAIGNITVAPLAIALASLVRNFPPRREIAEGIVALAVVSLVCALLVFLPNEPWTAELAIGALCPLLLWIASRLRPAFTAIATFICAITIVWTTIFAIGLFGDLQLSIGERVLRAQATILAISLGSLALAALFSERRLHEGAILEREARLREVLRAGSVMAFDWDVSADEIRFSQNATEILGLDAQQVLRGTEWLKHIHPEDQPLVASYLDTRPDRPSHSIAFRYRRPDGGEVWLEQIAIVRFGSGGTPGRISGLTTDVTERKRFNEELSLAWKTAEGADRAKSSFLAAASHDLRQPLQTLKLLQEALEPHYPSGEARNLVAGIGQSLDTMTSILSSLLDVNRLESGNLRPTVSEFSVSEIFESLTGDFAAPALERGLRLRIVRSGLIIRSDRRMLAEMIRNLLSNAIRYTDKGRILLGCRRASDNVRIEVWDNGVGITEDDLPHIFHEYYQGTDGAERGGFGLGLAIVNRLGKILDHRIDVRSIPGKGTRFFIEVRRGRSGVKVPEAAPPVHPHDAFLGSVLVIEDEASVRSALGRLLKKRGVDATIVATATEALTLVREQRLRPDVLLCDYNLRGSPDGIETIRHLRAALGRNVRATVMTGDTRSQTVDSISAQGISVLIKPFPAEELLEALRGQTSRAIM